MNKKVIAILNPGIQPTYSDCSQSAVVKRPNNKDVMVTPELPRPRMPPTLKLFPRYFRDEHAFENCEEPAKPKKPSRARLFEEPVKEKAVSPHDNLNNNLPEVDVTEGFSEVNIYPSA